MSAKASFWAWDQDLPSVHHRCILLCLADCHNPETGQCNPSIPFIVKKTKCNKKTVMKVLDSLAESGFISKDKGAGTSNKYTLHIEREDTQTSTASGSTASGSTTGGPSLTRYWGSTTGGTGVVPLAVPEPKKNLKRNSNPPSEKKFSEDDRDFAGYMFDRIRQVIPYKQKPNFDKWADAVRLMRERDGLPLPEIRRVFDAANQDAFWKTNIASPEKLREKFPQLHAKLLAGQDHPPTKDWD